MIPTSEINPAPPMPLINLPVTICANPLAVPAMIFPTTKTHRDNNNRRFVPNASYSRRKTRTAVNSCAIQQNRRVVKQRKYEKIQRDRLTASRPVIGCTMVVVNIYDVDIHVRESVMFKAPPIVDTEVATIVSSNANRNIDRPRLSPIYKHSQCFGGKER